MKKYFFIFLLFFSIPSLVFAADVPFLSQVPPGVWSGNKNCGPTSVIMVDAFYNKKTISYLDIISINDWMSKNLGIDHYNYQGQSTSFETLSILLIDKFNFSKKTIFVDNFDLDTVITSIGDGNIVIPLVYTNMFLYGLGSPSHSADVRHFMVLTGIDNEYVYVNDPGKTYGKNNKYTIDQFKKAWALNGNQAIVFRSDVLNNPPYASESSWGSIFLSPMQERLLTELREKKTVLVSPPPKVGDTDTDLLPVYDASFSPSVLSLAVTGTVAEVRVYAKYTGNIAIHGRDVSLNILGGRANAEQYHTQDWKTALRSANAQEQSIAPGDTMSFVFPVNFPGKDPKDVQFRMVRFAGGEYEWLGDSVFSLTLLRERKVPEVLVEALPERAPDTVRRVLGEKIRADSASDVFPVLPIVFSGSGTSAVPNSVGGGGLDSSIESGSTSTTIGVGSTSTTENVPSAIPAHIEFTSFSASFFPGDGRIDFSYETTSTGDVASYYDFSFVDIDTGALFSTSTFQNILSIPAILGHRFSATVVAHGESGGRATSTKDIVFDWGKRVVFSEIAWMGTASMRDCPFHEWMELYNPYDESVNMSGWKIIIFSGSNSSTIPLAGSISSGDYGVVLRNDGHRAILDIPSLAEYSGINLPNSGARLLLVNSSGVVEDEVDMRSGWSAGVLSGGTGGLFRPMSRVSHTLPGSAVYNWYTPIHVSSFWRTNNCGALLGSPGGPANAMPLLTDPWTYYAEWVNASNTLVLTASSGPYVLDYTVQIPSGAILFASPGVVFVGFDPSSVMSVYGTLRISGTESSPVIFTSQRDVLAGAYKKTSSFAGLFSSPVAGDWSRVEVKNGGVIEADHAVFRYGGKPVYRGMQWGLTASQISSSVSILGGGKGVFQNSVFRDSFVNSGFAEGNASLYTEGALNVTTSVEILNSIFAGGYYGAIFDAHSSDFLLSALVQNTVFSDFSAPRGTILFRRTIPSMEGLSFENNADSHVFCLTCSVQRGASVTLDSSAKVYAEGVEILDGGMLVLQSGSSVSFAGDTGIEVQSGGTFISAGSAEARNMFSPLVESSPWSGINVFASGTAHLFSSDLQYCGRVIGACIKNSGGLVRVEDGGITHTVSAQSVQMSSGNTNMLSSRIVQENGDALMSSGVNMTGGILSIENTLFHGMDYGIYAFSGADMSLSQTLSLFENIRIAPLFPETLFDTWYGAPAPLDAESSSSVPAVIE